MGWTFTNLTQIVNENLWNYSLESNLFGNSKDNTVERKNSTNTFGGVIKFARSSADYGQQYRNDFFDTQRSEGRQGNNAIDGALTGFKLLGEPRQEFIHDDGVLAVAEVAHDGNGEALGGREMRTTDGIQQIGDSHHSGVQHGFVGLNGARFQQILNDKNIRRINLCKLTDFIQLNLTINSRMSSRVGVLAK